LTRRSPILLAPENRAEVLPRFFHCSKHEAKAVSAEILPAEAAPHRDVVTALRAERQAAPEPTRPVELANAPRAEDLKPAVHLDETTASAVTAATDVAAPAREQRDIAEPLTADLRRRVRLQGARPVRSPHPAGEGRASTISHIRLLCREARLRRRRDGPVQRPAHQPCERSALSCSLS